MILDRILVAVDGSAESGRALGAASELAGKGGGKVLVLHVRQGPMVVNAGAVMAALVEGEGQDEAARLVDAGVAQIRKTGAEATGRVAEGVDVSRTILSEAEEVGASVIVMGSRGLSDISGLILGSVAHKVIHLARCPILLVR